MDGSMVVVLVVILAVAAGYALAIGGSFDALTQPRAAWPLAGYRRNRWVWQAFGVFVLPAGLVYSGIYFLRVRPRLTAAVRRDPVERGPLPPSSQTSAGVDAEPVKIRVPLAVAVVLVGPAVAANLAILGLIALKIAPDRHLPPAVVIPWMLILIIGIVVNVVSPVAFGATLDTRHLVMQGFVRRRIAWSDVTAIAPRSTLGARYVRVSTRNGRPRRLRAPVSQIGIGRRRFENDVAVIERWWLSRTSEGD